MTKRRRGASARPGRPSRPVEEPADRWSTVGTWLAVAGIPLAYVPFAQDPRFHLQVLLAAVVVGLATVAPRGGGLPRPVLVTGLLGVGVALVAGVASAAPWASLLGRFPRYEGLPLLLTYVAMAYAGSRLVRPASPALRRQAGWALTAATVVLAGFAVVETIVRQGERILTTLGNASAAGMFGAMALGLLGHQAVLGRAGERAWVPRVGAVAAIVLTALSGSRGAFLAAGVVLLGLLVAAVWELRRRPDSTAGRAPGGRVAPPWRPVAEVVGALALLALVVLALPMTRSRVSGRSPLAADTVTGRELLWRETVRLIADRPVLGVGPSGFVDAIGAFHDAAWQRAVGPALPPDSPHNIVLQVAAAGGLVGLVVVAGLLALVGLELVRRLRGGDRWALGTLSSMVGLGVALLFHFTDPGVLLPAMFLAGSGLAVGGAPAARPVREEAAGWSSWWLRSAAALLAVFALLGLTAETNLWRGGRALVDGDPVRAAAAFDTAQRITPWDADLPRRAGEAEVRAASAQGRPAGQDPQSAVVRLRAACYRLPRSTECRLALADALDLAGRPADALTVLRAAARLDPTNVDVLLRTGIDLAQTGDTTGAERAFRRAAELRPSAADPWDDLAILYERSGRDTEAAAARAEAARRGAAPR